MRLIATTVLLALGLSLGFSAPALAETNVGVTAAVNQDAKAVVGSNIKTISLGDSVVFNQRIETGGGGLVQVLLADGTTFMVGPNSDLVIDSFVYDPNAGTAQVTASFTKGVLRFIGGQTSKTEGGVTINTPVGTMGIRGAMVDIVLDPPAGTPPHVDMLFGNEVTLEQGKDLLGRLYAAGYSLALGPDGKFDVLKTPPGWGSQIQAALAGKPGTKGGAPKGPSDGDVKNSDVANNNSGNGPEKNTGNGLSKEELDALLYAAAHYDELRNFILNNQHVAGYIGGVFTGGLTCDDYQNCGYQAAPGINDYRDQWEDYETLTSYEPTYALFAFDADGKPVGIQASFLTYVSCDCNEDESNVSFVYTGNGMSGNIAIMLPGETTPTNIPTHDDFLYSFDDPRENNPLNREIPNPDPYDETTLTVADTLDCENCSQLVKWGFWGFSASEADGVPIEGGIDFMGTWITGDMTTRAQLNNLASLDEENVNAYYTGDAVGVVHTADDETRDDYVATGDLLLTYSFGARRGTVDITDFDQENTDLDIHYDVNSVAGAPGFVGYTGGEGYAGSAQGAFVNNGSDVAAGVLGTFDYTFGYDQFPSYTVGGVFMGERAPTN